MTHEKGHMKPDREPANDEAICTFRPLLFLTYWNMSPPGAYSMAIARCVGVRNISLN